MLKEEVIDFLKKAPPFQFLDNSTLKDIPCSFSMKFEPTGTNITYQNATNPKHLLVVKKGEVGSL